jgi:hypothetical protein
MILILFNLLDSNEEFRILPILNPVNTGFIYIRLIDGNHYEAMIPKSVITHISRSNSSEKTHSSTVSKTYKSSKKTKSKSPSDNKQKKSANKTKSKSDKKKSDNKKKSPTKKKSL